MSVQLTIEHDNPVAGCRFSCDYYRLMLFRFVGCLSLIVCDCGCDNPMKRLLLLILWWVKKRWMQQLRSHFRRTTHQANRSLPSARLLAASAIHTGDWDWLHIIPVSACGLRLNDEAIRICSWNALLSRTICQSHQCPCGAIDDRPTHASHGFACKCNLGRSQRHHFLNDLVRPVMSGV